MRRSCCLGQGAPGGVRSCSLTSSVSCPHRGRIAQPRLVRSADSNSTRHWAGSHRVPPRPGFLQVSPRRWPQVQVQPGHNRKRSTHCEGDRGHQPRAGARGLLPENAPGPAVGFRIHNRRDKRWPPPQPPRAGSATGLHRNRRVARVDQHRPPGGRPPPQARGSGSGRRGHGASKRFVATGRAHLDQGPAQLQQAK